MKHVGVSWKVSLQARQTIAVGSSPRGPGLWEEHKYTVSQEQQEG